MPDEVFLQPGPVRMDPRVLAALARPTVHHRSKEFQAELTRFITELKQVFGTRHDVAVLSGSGTAGMEAAVASLAGPGDRVVVAENGKFGARMAEIASFHAECVRVAAPWGQAVDVEAVAAALDEAPTRLLVFVHNETSTGVLNPARELAQVARKKDALVVMDAVTSLGGVPVPVDEWGIDVCVTGSQKCLAGPAGLALLSVSDRALAASRRFSYYLDLKRHVEKARAASTPFTPAVPLFLATAEAVRMALEEGLEARFARTRRLAEATRAAVTALGLSLYATAGARSDTVTAVRYPDGLPDPEARVRGRLKTEHSVLVAGGQDAEKGRMFRVGHMGIVTEAEILRFVTALEDVLRAAGWDAPHGAGASAASTHFGAR